MRPEVGHDEQRRAAQAALAQGCGDAVDAGQQLLPAVAVGTAYEAGSIGQAPGDLGEQLAEVHDIVDPGHCTASRMLT